MGRATVAGKRPPGQPIHPSGPNSHQPEEARGDREVETIDMRKRAGGTRHLFHAGPDKASDIRRFPDAMFRRFRPRLISTAAMCHLRIRRMNKEHRNATVQPSAASNYKFKARIVIIDDHSLFRDGLAGLLGSQGFVVAGAAATAGEGLELIRTEQ